jgi:hypothetical protein
MAPYNYLGQDIVASALIQPYDNDSFFNPTDNNHTGYAADGTHYTGGVQDPGPVYASWYTEFGTPNDPYRDDQAVFPTYGLILLSPVSLVILDESTPETNANQLKLWMQFLLSDDYMLANNFNDSLQGFTPAALTYADGIISVTYTPDPGNQVPQTNQYGQPLPTTQAQSNMVVSIDFTTDSAYLDVAL